MWHDIYQSSKLSLLLPRINRSGEEEGEEEEIKSLLGDVREEVSLGINRSAGDKSVFV